MDVVAADLGVGRAKGGPGPSEGTGGNLRT